MNQTSINSDIKQVHDQDVTHFLKQTLQYKATRQAILAQRIVNQAAAERGVVVTDEAVQTEADRQRRDLRLERATDTLAWLRDQEIEAEDWESGIRDRLLTQNLKESLFANDLAKAFNQSRLDFDRVLLYQIVVPSAPLSQELFYQIEEEEMSFYEAAHLYDIDEQRRYRCGYEGLIPRWNMSPLLATTVFSVAPGELAGPTQTEQGYHLLLPEEFIAAQLTDEVREVLLDRLFQEWLQRELTYWNCQ